MTFRACIHEKELFVNDELNEVVEYCVKCLRPHLNEFDAIAISGYSMAIVGSILAHKLGKNIILVRKESDSSHSLYTVEGLYEQRVVLVDDLICSGDTFKYINLMLTSICCFVVGYFTYSPMHRYPYYGFSFPYWGIEQKFELTYCTECYHRTYDDECINSVCARFDKATYDTRVRRTLKLFKEESDNP